MIIILIIRIKMITRPLREASRSVTWTRCVTQHVVFTWSMLTWSL
jgi:hypothetical protein